MESFTGVCQKFKNKNSELFVLKISIRLRSRGRDAVTVYKIKYEVAWSRSGWTPHRRIRIRVGISEASKLM